MSARVSRRILDASILAPLTQPEPEPAPHRHHAGPARIGNDTFVGMQALVFRTELGDHVVVEPGAKLIGVKVASGRYVPALTLVTTQEQADTLPLITSAYPYRNLNEGVVTVNVQLAKAGQPKQIGR